MGPNPHSHGFGAKPRGQTAQQPRGWRIPRSRTATHPVRNLSPSCHAGKLCHTSSSMPVGRMGVHTHTDPGPLALLPTPHTSCLFHHLHWQLKLLILFVTAVGTAVPGRKGDGLWGFGVGSGKGQAQGAPSHVRPSLDTYGRVDPARAPTVRGAEVGG